MTSADTSSDLAPIADRADAPASLPTITAGGLTWRPAVPDDATALLELRNTIAEADAEPYRETIEEIVELFQAPWRRFDTDSLVGVDGEGRLRAYAMVESMPGDTRTVRAFLFGGVHPQVRGQGIGRELFAWQVARGRQVLAASGKDLPARLATMAEDDSPPPRLRLYERFGFTPRRFYSDLRRDLRDLDAAPLPGVTLDGTLRLVPFAAELDGATRLAHNDAFRDHWGSQPRTPESWRAYRSSFAPEWSFVVVDESVRYQGSEHEQPGDATVPPGTPYVVGLHMASRYEHDWESQGYTAGYTDLLGVRRDYRGRRVAVALLTHAMRVFADAGMQKAELDVDTDNPTGATGLYARLGYTKSDGSTLFTIEL